MSIASIHRPDSVAEHIIRCVSCDSDRVIGAPNAPGQWYGYCSNCGCRFWAYTDHLGRDDVL